MAEYINRDSLISQLEECLSLKPNIAFILKHIICILKEYPTADVVEVVRCKDCKDYKQNPYSPEEDMMCMCWCDWLPTDPDDFCSYGKRKEV
jgi:hypothetical protein